MEAVVLCGIQGAGKTTFYAERHLATHVRISRDLLRTAHREQRFLDLCLQTRQPFVVDKINHTRAARAPYVQAARAAGFRVVAVWLDVPPREALARNARRSGRAQVPVAAVLGTKKRLELPSPDEGFDAVWRAWAAPGGGFHVEPLAPAAGEPDRFTRDAPVAR